MVEFDLGGIAITEALICERSAVLHLEGPVWVAQK